MNRCDLKPGTIFRNPFGWWLERAGIPEPLVVLDDLREVGFWRGEIWTIGLSSPDAVVEVLS